MRFLIRHAIALLLFTFAFRLVWQAREENENSGVPKALLLASLSPQSPIPSRPIDTRPIILAITRELIRQIQSVLQTFATNYGVSLVIGETKSNIDSAQVLITVPGYLKNKLIDRKKSLDLSELKMIVYDEADELFSQKDNHECFLKLQEYLKKIDKKP